MKLKSLIASTVISVIILSGCSANVGKTKDSQQPNQQSTNESKTNSATSTKNTINKSLDGITFSFSSSYKKITPSNAPPTLVAYLINDKGSNFNAVVEKIASDITLDQYAKASFENSGLKAESSKKFKSNNLEWHEVISNTEVKGITIRLNQRTMVSQGKAYVFSYAGMPEYYDKHLQEFEDIINSVKIVDSNTETTSSTVNSSESTKSNDPVYNEMMDPNTDLGKSFAKINEQQNWIDKESERRAKQKIQNDIDASLEKKELIAKIAKEKENLKSIPKDDIRYKWKENDIALLESKLITNYKDVK